MSEPRFPTEGLLILILASTVAIVLIFSVVAATVKDREISEEGMKMMDQMTTGIIAILSMYVGSKIRAKNGGLK